MGLKFTCKKCGQTGESACSAALPLVHCGWYREQKGLIHGCLYCRSCGAVHDTIGPLLGVIKMLFGRLPSKVVATFEFSELKKITKINNPDFPSLRSMNPFIIALMIEDGRLTEDEDLTEEPTVDFLLDCLTDNNFIVRREAITALGRHHGKKVVDALIQMLKDKNREVKKNAAVTLGDLGDDRAIKPLEELITGTWDGLVIDAAAKARKKLKS